MTQFDDFFGIIIFKAGFGNFERCTQNYSTQKCSNLESKSGISYFFEHAQIRPNLQQWLNSQQMVQLFNKQILRKS